MAADGRRSPALLAVEIPSTETNSSERWKPVTLYMVRIIAVGRQKDWTVYRRYSKFYDLSVQLHKRFLNHALPPIPRKRRIGKEDPQFIKQRQHELADFLNALLLKPVEISLSEELCLFLEVPNSLRLSFLESDPRSRVEPHRIQPAPEQAPPVVNGFVKQHESLIARLLFQLHEFPNSKVASMRSFEDSFLKTAPQVTEADAQLLFLGQHRQGGLLEEVGAFEHSEVSSVAALGLLGRLLNQKRCSDAALFRMVLCRLDLSILSRMRLQHHIHRNRGHNIRLDAFRVLRSLDLPTDRLQVFLQDDFTLREYRRWSDDLNSSLSMRTLHRPAQTRHGTPAIGNLEMSPQRMLTRREYRKIAETAFTSVQMWLTTFALPDIDGNRTSSASSSARASGVGAPGQPPQWRHVPCPEASWRTRYGARAAYQKVPFEEQSDAYVVRATMLLPFPAFLVAALLADHAAFIREALALRGLAVEQPQEDQQHQQQDEKILHEQHAERERQEHPPPTPQLLADAVLERLRQLASGQLVFQMQTATLIKSLKLGTSHEASSELYECHLGPPSTPHLPVRLWLLKSLRILPPGHGSSPSPASSQGSCAACLAFSQSDEESPRVVDGVGDVSSKDKDDDCRINDDAGFSDAAARTVAVSFKFGEETAVAAAGAASPELVHQLPSYLFLCTAVPPVATQGRKQDGHRGERPNATSCEYGNGADGEMVAPYIAVGGKGGGADSVERAAGSVGDAEDVLTTAVSATSSLSLPLSRPSLQLPGLGGTSRPAGALRSDLNGLGGLPGKGGGPSLPRVISLKPSGVRITPADDGSRAEVSLSALLHKDTVRLVSGDLLGERLIFWSTFENIVFVLETLCPLPPGFDHPLRAQQERCLSGVSASNRRHRTVASKGRSSSTSSRCSRESPRSGSPSSSKRSLEVELVEMAGPTFN
eukprot:TRINITY_DN19233_c0_g1_i1.p1 TRINITY_DN19233_c0_g1~~TRINITY_DN19233_c0_g1_i1.p1  ORF type:complete len:943 (+),score=157.81 TRINITY_DN19233_c0_g1_i1:26-2830(+)